MVFRVIIRINLIRSIFSHKMQMFEALLNIKITTLNLIPNENHKLTNGVDYYSLYWKKFIKRCTNDCAEAIEWHEKPWRP